MLYNRNTIFPRWDELSGVCKCSLELIPGNFTDYTTNQKTLKVCTCHCLTTSELPVSQCWQCVSQIACFLTLNLLHILPFFMLGCIRTWGLEAKDYTHPYLQRWTRIRCSGFGHSLLPSVSSEIGLNIVYRWGYKFLEVSLTCWNHCSLQPGVWIFDA